eukprot:5304389-Amphidinium_carterae.1
MLMRSSRELAPASRSDWRSREHCCMSSTMGVTNQQGADLPVHTKTSGAEETHEHRLLDKPLQKHTYLK